jgi:hypothetical protein
LINTNKSGKNIGQRLFNSFIFLGQSFFSGKGDIFFKPFGRLHYYIEHRVKRFLKSNKRIFLLRMPRGFGKTKLVSVLLVIWLVFVKKRNYCVIWSHSGDLAQQILRTVENCLKNQLFRKVFPWTREVPWSISAGKLRFRRKRGGMAIIEARGIMAQAVGWSEAADRPDVFVFDDLEDPNQPKDLEFNARVIGRLEIIFYGLSMESRTGQVGRSFYVGTRHYKGCVIDKISKWRGVDCVAFPCLITTLRMAQILKGHIGESIWEEGRPTEALLQQKDDAYERGQGHIWEAQMMDVLMEGTQTFDENLIRLVKKSNVPDLLRAGEVAIECDMAYTKGNRRDSTGISVSLFRPPVFHTVLETLKGQWAPADFYELTYKLTEKYKSAAKWKGLFAESTASVWISNYFEQRNQVTGRKLKIQGLRSKRYPSKEDRIALLPPQMEAGNLEFVEGRCTPLLREMAEWTGKARSIPGSDDVLDSTSWGQVLLERDGTGGEVIVPENEDWLEKEIHDMTPAEQHQLLAAYHFDAVAGSMPFGINEAGLM